MKIKYRFIISFCFVFFVSFFNCINVFSIDFQDNMGSIDVVAPLVNADSNYTSAKNVAMIHQHYHIPGNTSLTGDAYFLLYSGNAINIVDTGVVGSSVNFSLTSTGTYSSHFYHYRSDNYNYDYSGASGGLSMSNTVVDSLSYYNLRGTVYLGTSSSSITVDSKLLNPSNGLTSKDDILNFNWKGNGLKIYNLEKNMKVSGYMNKETGLKWFDIECYGQFSNSSSSWFSSFAKKNMQTKLQNNCYVTVGGETRHVGEGVGIKSFEWVGSDSTDVGSLMKFRMVLTVPMLCVGSNNVVVGTTLPDGSEYIKDNVDSVNFLSNNADSYGQPPVDGGSTSYVEGNSPGNSETYKGSDSSITGFLSVFTSIGTGIFDFFKSILDVLTSVGTIAPQLASTFSALFMFLPSPIPQLIVTSFVIIILVSVLKFLRG